MISTWLDVQRMVPRIALPRARREVPCSSKGRDIAYHFRMADLLCLLSVLVQAISINEGTSKPRDSRLTSFERERIVMVSFAIGIL